MRALIMIGLVLAITLIAVLAVSVLFLLHELLREPVEPAPPSDDEEATLGIAREEKLA